MTDAGQHTAVTAWVWGGALLIASTLLPLVAFASLMATGAAATVIGWVGTLAFTAALVVFAFGLRGRGSVVARQRSGTVALTVWALAGPASSLVALLLPAYSDTSADLYAALFYGRLLVWVGAGLVAVFAIGRARAVPAPWNWAPAWGLPITVGVGVLVEVAGVALAGRVGDPQEALGLLYGLSSLASTLVPMLLGILAIVLGLRTEARPIVQVFPPAPQ